MISDQCLDIDNYINNYIKSGKFGLGNALNVFH